MPMLPPAPPPFAGTGNGNPTPAEVPAERCEPQAPEPPYVLIALVNGWVYAAVGYSVENDTLHYITMNGEHKEVSLEMVNRSLSEWLNRKSEIGFDLP